MNRQRTRGTGVNQSICRIPLAFPKALVLLQILASFVGSGWSGSAFAQVPIRPSRTSTQPAQSTRAVPIQNPLTITQPTSRPALRGFVDLHTHPMTNLAFGGKLLYGGVDGFQDTQGNPQGTFLPADPNCQHNVLAGSMEQALGHDRSTHGVPLTRFDTGWISSSNPSGTKTFNACGNFLRAKIVHALQKQLNLPNKRDFNEDACGLQYLTDDNPAFCKNTPFSDWPTWDDVTHQKMWVDWILRAYAGGLRVMVALATNSRLIGDVVTLGNSSSTPDLPTDDKTTADFQISEIRRFVGNHSDWMQVAYTSEDLYQIVSSNRLAVVIGVEIDQIGNFTPVKPPSDAQIRAEIDRLYSEGVRYIFPIHVVDNVFGGTATYEDLFNLANLYEDGALWDLTCANNPQTDGFIRYQFSGLFGDMTDSITNFAHLVGLPFPPHPALPAACPNGPLKNALGLRPAGYVALEEMMRLGMLIDIDHMSQQAVDETLAFVSRPEFRYPVMSGHNAVRAAVLLPGDVPTERNFRPDQYQAIGALHGMAGVGNAGGDAWEWMYRYYSVLRAMCLGMGTSNESVNCGVSAGFGTDTDGLVEGNPPPTGHPPVTYLPIPISNSWLKSYAPAAASAFPPVLPVSSYGQKTWDYNTVGFAHYGLLPDFLKDARNMPAPCTGCPSGVDLVDGNVMNGADYFYHTWQMIEIPGLRSGIPKATPLPTLSATICPSLDGKSCASNTTANTPWEIVTVTTKVGVPEKRGVLNEINMPVGGATVTTNSGFTALTDAHGVAVIPIYRGPCYAPGSQVAQVGQTTVPQSTQVPCPAHTATVTKAGYQIATIGLH